MTEGSNELHNVALFVNFQKLSIVHIYSTRLIESGLIGSVQRMVITLKTFYKFKECIQCKHNKIKKILLEN